MALRDWFRRRDRYAETRDEIDAHLRLAIADRIAHGESPDAASRHAHREFGSVRATLDDARGVWGWTRLEQLWFDAKSGARILTSAPGLSVSVILLVALVIGGNTTIYSAVHAMLTKPAPGVNPDGLAVVSWSIDHGRTIGPDTTLEHFEAIAARASGFDAAAFRVEHLSLTREDGTFAVRGVSATADYFPALGVTFVHGRPFSPDEQQPGAGGLVAVISQRLWERQFGSDPAIAGRAIAVNGHPATIVGVAAAPFQGAWLAEATDLWVPLEAFAKANGSERELRDGNGIHGVVIRAHDGTSLAAAEGRIRAISGDVNAAARAGTPPYEPTLAPYTGIAARNSLIARFGPRFLAIFSIVTLLTVCIVCANVANLMLARAVSRQREMAVRQSFGASRWRITRLVLAENLTLSLCAWAAACLFAYWMARLLPGIIPASESGGAEVLLDFTPDWTVLAYAMLLALTAAATFTIAPALRTWRLDLLSFLKAGERGSAPGRARAARSLVVVQLALSVVLLTSAGLAYRSLSLVVGRDLGFDTSRMLLMTVDMTAAARTPEAKRLLLDSVLESIRSVPVVESASYAQQAPSQGWSTRPATTRPGTPELRVERNEVGPDYLATLGLRPIAGVEFDAHSGGHGRAEAIVNQELAAALWPGESPIGRELNLGNLDQKVRVVGIAPNAMIGGYRRDDRYFVALLSMRQVDRAGSFLTFHVRYNGGLDSAVPAISRAMRQAAPSVPITYVRTMESTLHDATWMTRTLTTLLILFAAGSLFIAALGQYAAMSFAMGQRVRDFAIRIAMGASARQILGPAMREGLVLTAIGLAIGLVLGSAAGTSGRSLLHGVTPTDATTYAAVFVVLGAASLAACYVPARRASKVDPIEALRAE